MTSIDVKGNKGRAAAKRVAATPMALAQQAMQPDPAPSYDEAKAIRQARAIEGKPDAEGLADKQARVEAGFRHEPLVSPARARMAAVYRQVLATTAAAAPQEASRVQYSRIVTADDLKAAAAAGAITPAVYRAGLAYIAHVPPGATLISLNASVIMVAPDSPPCYVTPTGLVPLAAHPPILDATTDPGAPEPEPEPEPDPPAA